MYTLGDKQIPGEEVEFEPEREVFNVYICQDGTKLRFKAVVTQVVRLDAWKPDGEPVYLVNSAQVVSADVPDSLKRKE
jgi:hypothetical protein